MREQRWESKHETNFEEVLALTERLSSLGVKPVHSGQDIICYIEDWEVGSPEEVDRLEGWPKEDVTLVHIHERWRGDFYLMGGEYHTVYRKHRGIGTYCSISHPWVIPEPLKTHHPQSMFWVGFRHTHGFIRVRLQTQEVVAPGEPWEDFRRELWLKERSVGFGASVRVLELPVHLEVEKGQVCLRTSREDVALFCSWPDAFGPCQFEFNSSDPFEFLVPATRLAQTCLGQFVTVRAYLTGFNNRSLHEFQRIQEGVRLAYRCSVHAPFGDLPEILGLIQPNGRVYGTLCEFHLNHLFPGQEHVYAIVGLVGKGGGFKIETRLNRNPFPREQTKEWIENFLGLPMRYAPLPPFP